VITIRLQQLLGIALVAVAAWGCGTSASSYFYNLDSTAKPGGAPAESHRVIVGPVTVPSSVDRPEFVVRIAPNRVDVDEFNRWIAPLGEAIAQTVAGDLVALLGTPDVVTAPFANFDPDYRVTIGVERFETIPGDSVLVEAVWVVRGSASGVAHSGRTVAREAVAADGFEALPAAHSRALARLSSDIAAAIRTDAGAR
jgi:hypothetical protein